MPTRNQKKSTTSNRVRRDCVSEEAWKARRAEQCRLANVKLRQKHKEELIMARTTSNLPTIVVALMIVVLVVRSNAAIRAMRAAAPHRRSTAAPPSAARGDGASHSGSLPVLPPCSLGRGSATSQSCRQPPPARSSGNSSAGGGMPPVASCSSESNGAAVFAAEVRGLVMLEMVSVDF